MGTLTERVKSIAHQETENAASLRRQAADELRAIVLRGTGHEDDRGTEERLRELFRELAARPEEYAGIVSMIEAAALWEAREAQWSAVGAGRSDARAEVGRITQWEAEQIASIKAKAAAQRAPHENLLREADSASAQRNATQRERMIAQRNWMAFREGQPLPYPEALPGSASVPPPLM